LSGNKGPLEAVSLDSPAALPPAVVTRRKAILADAAPLTPTASNGSLLAPTPSPKGASATQIALALGIVLMAAAALRLWHINGLGYNGDETIYAGQGAALADAQGLADFFPIFRAHPLLFQSILAVGFDLGFHSPFERFVSAAFGIAAVLVVFAVGQVMYGRRAGLIAAAIVAFMPYHVVVSRQVLLDGPMVLFAMLTLLLVAKYSLTERPMWLYAAGAALGLTVLSKEPSVLFFGAICIFFALAPQIRVRFRTLAGSLILAGVIASPTVLAAALAGASRTGGNYLTWQLFRRANHDWLFYPTTLPGAIGPLVLIAAGGGLWFLRREATWRETLLLTWIAIPMAFFQVWPVKGYQYLLPAAPAVAVLAGRAISRWWDEGGVMPGQYGARTWAPPLVAGLVAVSLLVPAVNRVRASSSPQTASFSSLAGTGGIPGGREAGRWLDAHVPKGGRIMTIGPSMANVVRFYAKREAFGLSVSPNPLNRNPSYEPIVNPDLQLRHGEMQYLVWDAFSAERSPFFSRSLLRYADRYNGRVVHSESVTDGGRSGGEARRPVIVVYEVRP